MFLFWFFLSLIVKVKLSSVSVLRVTASKSWRWADAELLINELCFVRSCGEVVGPCFCLLLSFVLITMSTKVGIWDCYLTRWRQTRGRPSCRSQISLLISALWMLIPRPEVCEHKNCWIVCSISELQTYLTFFVVSNKKIVFSLVDRAARGFMIRCLTDGGAVWQ